MQEIEVADLETRRKRGEAHLLLDVREAAELATASIVGARHIPVAEIAARIDEIPADMPVIVMCHHGGRSARAVAYLHQHGRPNAVNLHGGIDAWSVEIDPSVPRY
jgi:rhodanese-related sulfurtransferase